MNSSGNKPASKPTRRSSHISASMESLKLDRLKNAHIFGDPPEYDDHRVQLGILGPDGRPLDAINRDRFEPVNPDDMSSLIADAQRAMGFDPEIH